MTDFIAEDMAAIREALPLRERGRAEAQAYWCVCGHPSRMIPKNDEGRAVCSACRGAVDE